MKPNVVMAGGLLVSVLWQHPADAWTTANRYGGSTTHVYGEGTEHTNAYGGSSAHAYGGGSEHTNVYGGRTYGAYGEGAVHTYPSGASAYHPPGYGGYAGYPAYHPPVAVPYYSASGCNGCAVAAGAIVGMTAGAAVARAATAPAPAPVAYAALPAGCVYRLLPHRYDCGGMWLAPTYGANGVYYVVSPP